MTKEMEILCHGDVTKNCSDIIPLSRAFPIIGEVLNSRTPGTRLSYCSISFGPTAISWIGVLL